MRNTTAKGRGFNLAAALETVAEQPAVELTLAELVRAYAAARCDGSETCLRKWVEAFGTISAWQLTSDRLQVAAQALREHGYTPAAVNRDLSALGSAYRWARERRFAPRGFRSPTLDVPRYEEARRRRSMSHPRRTAMRLSARCGSSKHLRRALLSGAPTRALYFADHACRTSAILAA